MLKRVVVSKEFFISVIAFVVVCFMYKIYILQTNETVSLLKLCTKYKHSELVIMGEDLCAYRIIDGVRYFEWFAVVFPVITAFPFAYSFANEWKSSVYMMSVTRCGEKRYVLKNIFGAMVSGFLVAVLGMLVVSALVYLMFPGISAFEYHEMIDMSYGDTAYKLIGFYLKMVFNLGLQGAMCALCATLLVVICDDMFYALTIPMMIEYLSMKLTNYYLLWIRNNNIELNSKTNIPMILNPNEQFFMDVRSEIYNFKYGVYVLVCGILTVLIGVLLYKLMRRRRLHV